MSRNIVVLHTIAGLKRSSGGTSSVVPALCETLGRRGATVFLVAQDGSDNKDTNILPDSQYVQTKLIRSFVLKAAGLTAFPSSSKAIRQLCKTRQVNIIHDNGLWLPSNHAVAITARRLGIPLVIQPHGMLEPWALSFRAWKKHLAWKFYQKRNLETAAVLVATSMQEAESIRKVGLTQPIAVIPNGVDLPDLKKQSDPKKRTKSALFLSRIHPIKGLMNLVSAWNEVRPEGWRMIVAGPDEDNHRVEIESAVHRAGLENDFQFIDAVEGVTKEKLYREADLFILPTYSENFGVVVAEALAYGAPVITTKGAPWEALVENSCGWWVDIGVEPLAEAIRDATSLTDDERQAMGLRGRAYVEESFSWPRIAEQMKSVYEWVLGKGSMPDCVMVD